MIYLRGFYTRSRARLVSDVLGLSRVAVFLQRLSHFHDRYRPILGKERLLAVAVNSFHVSLWAINERM